MPAPRVLGQLLLMQSVVNELPDTKSIFSFVCNGLNDIPGVSGVEFSSIPFINKRESDVIFALKRNTYLFGELLLNISNKEYQKYHAYVKNFVFMLEIILEERRQHELNKKHQSNLENIVEQRTKQLSKEVEQKIRLEKHLRQSEELFRTSFENATVGVCLVNTEGQFLKTNAKFCELFSYNTNELKGNSIDIITHPEDIELSRELINKMISGNNKQNIFTKRYIHKDKSVIQALVSTALIKDSHSNKSYFVTHVLDITEQEKNRKRLEESEKRYRSLFENMTTGMVLIEISYGKGKSSGYKLLDMNPAAEKLTGIKAKKLIGKTNKDLPFRTEYNWIGLFIKVAKTAKPESIQMYSKTFNKHLEVWIFKQEQNKVAIIINDITNRKIAEIGLEEQKQKLEIQNKEYEDLNKTLAQINSELRIAKKKAEESDRLKTAFLANMSHEVRTPMNGILGFSDLLLKHGLTDDKRNYYVKTIINSGNQLLRIVNDILDISKIEIGQIAISEEIVYINKMIRDLKSLYQHKATQKKVNLIVALQNTKEKLTVYTDGGRLKQIISNLLHNAFKFTNEGSITFGYHIKAKQILFFVKDTGIGIPHEYLEKIFDRFLQVETEMTKHLGGTGLGLSISKKLVSLLGGDMWVESKLNKGSEFYFTIPLKHVELVYEKQNPSNSDFKQKISSTILIAEDKDINYEYLVEVLYGTGISHIRAKDGFEAIEMCKKNPHIGLVLMDIRMPNLNGLDATKQIKLFRPDLPIIAQTAFAMHEDKDKAFKAGCDDYLSKPTTKEDLVRMISKYLVTPNSE